MDLTVQIVVRNNRNTILKTLESIRPLGCDVLVADAGSTDGTPDLCRGCKIIKIDPQDGYHSVRNVLTDKSQTDWQMYLHPWETLAQGHQDIGSTKIAQRVSVLQNHLLTKEVRIWKKSQGLKFCNYVYEYLDCDHAELHPIYIFSAGRSDYKHALDMVLRWRGLKPFDPKPHYYQALTHLALGNYDEFINSSEHYMFLDTKKSVSTVMNRYYYALVQVFRLRKARPALQNLNLCIEAKPLMAEFWSLIGDVYYHLYNKYETAKDFYENALILGGRRMSDDVWPMDVSKYENYPNTMINSCSELIKRESFFISSNESV